MKVFNIVRFEVEEQNGQLVEKVVLDEPNVLQLCQELNLIKLDGNSTALDADVELGRELLRLITTQTAKTQYIIGFFGNKKPVQSELAAHFPHLPISTSELTEQGLYCTHTTIEETKESLIIAFAWLDKQNFESENVRSNATYILRLLTKITSNIVCCLDNKDVQHLTSISQLKNVKKHGWQDYVVSFSVEKKEVDKDQVQIAYSRQCGQFLYPEHEGEEVHLANGNTIVGCFQSVKPPCIKKEKKSSNFCEPSRFVDWLIATSKEFVISFQCKDIEIKLFQTELCARLGYLETKYIEVVKEDIQLRFKEGFKFELENLDRDKQSFFEMVDDAGIRIFYSSFSNDNIKDVVKEIRLQFHEFINRLRDQYPSLQNSLKKPLPGAVRLPIVLKNSLNSMFKLYNYNSSLTEIWEHINRFQEAKVNTSLMRKLGSLFFWDYFSNEGNFLQFLIASPELKQLHVKWVREMKSLFEIVRSCLLSKIKEDLNRRQLEETAGTITKIKKEAFFLSIQHLQKRCTKQLSLVITAVTKRGCRILCKYTEDHLIPARTRELIAYDLSGSNVYHQWPKLMEINIPVDEKILTLQSLGQRRVLCVRTSNIGTTVQIFSTGFSKEKASFFKSFPKPSSHSDFDVTNRVLAVLGLAKGEYKILYLFRFDDKFKLLEQTNQIDVSLRTSMELPIKDIKIFGQEYTVLLMDKNGDIQSVNLRSKQASRRTKNKWPTFAKMLKVTEKSVFLVVSIDESSRQKLYIDTCMLIDHQLLPTLIVDLPFDVLNGARFCCSLNCMKDKIFVLNQSQGDYHEYSLNIQTRSDSYQIQSESISTSSDGNSYYASHWLWSFFHLYEKFPVRGMIGDGEKQNVSEALCLHFPSLSSREIPAEFMEEVMSKLRSLQKPLHGLELSQSITVGNTNMMEYLNKLSVADSVLELISFVPVQICRAEENRVNLMFNGSYDKFSTPENIDAASIAQSLRFGLLSALLRPWQGHVVVVTSMGKQSTGKSYFLNHLTGASFAISGARCTDGCWITCRPVGKETMLVIMDFEGLGSFERSDQEDVFLSVLNAAVSMFTVFRVEMRFDKDIDHLFQKFQQGMQLIKGDPKLFQGMLYMSVKDVNPNDQHGVVHEFRSKIEALLENNKENNFVTEMYGGRVNINCSPPLLTPGYYESMKVAARMIMLTCHDYKQRSRSYRSGAAFLDSLRLVLAKIYLLDWTSMDSSAIKMQAAILHEQVPGVVRFGCKVFHQQFSMEMKDQMREPISTIDGHEIEFSLEQLCQLNPSLAPTWTAFTSKLVFDIPNDAYFDLGLNCLNGSNPDQCNKDLSAAMTNMFEVFMYLMGNDIKNSKHRKECLIIFDSFVSFVVIRRKQRVLYWIKSHMEGKCSDEVNYVDDVLQKLKYVFVRCHSQCDDCNLGCIHPVYHKLSLPHSCQTKHQCTLTCEYCQPEKNVDCKKKAGHEGMCECAEQDHTCGEPCLYSNAINCNGQCTEIVGHKGEHVCEVDFHCCSTPCSARNCQGPCILDSKRIHTVHKCAEIRCLEDCELPNCSNSCDCKNHFHADVELSSIFAEENAVTLCDLPNSELMHMCANSHRCAFDCRDPGICDVEVQLKQSSKMYQGKRSAFQYVYQEMNGTRKKCAQVIQPFKTSHEGDHCCIVATNVTGDEKDAIAVHYCDQRCPLCEYFCNQEYNHSGLHSTSHGNMRNTHFVSEDQDIDVQDRKYMAGENGIAEMCPMFCSKLGRGHVHFDPCEQEDGNCLYSVSGGETERRRHSSLILEPHPEASMDELLHEEYWSSLGWADPCQSTVEREEFKKCPYSCTAPDHESEKSFCILNAWHCPATEVPNDGYSYVSGHQFECNHRSMYEHCHHIFVLDASGSMRGSPWQRLMSAVSEYLENRKVAITNCEDTVSIITFASGANIAYEQSPITSVIPSNIEYTGGGTCFKAGLRTAIEILSRSNHKEKKPVVLFFSDGHPQDPSRGYELATHINETFTVYDLRSFIVGFGSINSKILQNIANKMGGVYHHVVTGIELEHKFFEISASLGTTSGLMINQALPNRRDLKECNVCLDKMRPQSIRTLSCKHQFHAECVERLPTCPLCRSSITATA